MVVDGTPGNHIGHAIRQMHMGLLIGKAARKDGKVRFNPVGQVALYIIVADVDAISQQSVQLVTTEVRGLLSESNQRDVLHA